MVKSAVCSVAVNHFIHQIELRTLKAPSAQPKCRRGVTWDYRRASGTLACFQAASSRCARKYDPGCSTCLPPAIHFLDPKEIVKGIFHWLKEKWNSHWNATKDSWWKQAQQRVDISSIVTEKLTGRPNFSCWKVNTVFNGHTCTVHAVFKGNWYSSLQTLKLLYLLGLFLIDIYLNSLHNKKEIHEV